MQQSLLPKVAAGDASAVEACIDRYGGLVWSLARRLVGAQADIEDAVQEVFIELWKSAARFDAQVASEETFVAMIARRRLIDSRRRRMRRLDQTQSTPVDEVDVAVEASHQESVITADDVERAAEAIQQLRPEQQQVLRLSVYEGWSHQRIADHLQVPLGTVKTHVRRSLIRIRDLLHVEIGQRTDAGVKS